MACTDTRTTWLGVLLGVALGAGGVSMVAWISVSAPDTPAQDDDAKWTPSIAPVVTDSRYPLGLPILDAHVHTPFVGTHGTLPMTFVKPADFAASCRETGVVGGCAMTVLGPDGYYADESKLGFITAASIGDKVGDPGPFIHPDQLAEIEAGLKSGKFNAIKFYLGYVWKNVNDEYYDPAWELARKYGVPIICHTGDTFSTDGRLDFAHPLTIDQAAVEHRDVTIVIAHMGNPWFIDAAEVIYKNPNVYGEFSAPLLGNPAHYTRKEVRESLQEPLLAAWSYVQDPSKIMFATDWPLMDMKNTALACMEVIPQKHWDAFFYDNARRVFTKMKPIDDAPAPTPDLNPDHPNAVP